MKNQLTILVLGMLAALSSAASAQTAPSMDSSGNWLLNGNYNFRHVTYVSSDLGKDTTKKILLYGTIQFDGIGGYTLNGTELNTATGDGRATGVGYSGTYTLGASGYGFLTNPSSKKDVIYGLLSNGIFIGGSTESGFNDLLIATPASANTTVASFNGVYQVAAMDVPSGDHKDITDFSFTLRPDGAGQLGNLEVLSYLAGSSESVANTIPGVPYAFKGGIGVLQTPQSSTAPLSGDQMLYMSPDGNFLFGGSPASFNMLIGVRTQKKAIRDRDFSGLYYQAGLDHDASDIADKNQSVLSNYYGSFVVSEGVVMNHQRVNALVYPTPLDYTFTDLCSRADDGTATDTFQKYWFGVNGRIRIGIGIQPYLGLSVAVKAPVFSGRESDRSSRQVFVDPTSLVNAANHAPFTAALSPGELVTLSGRNLATSAATSGGLSAPTELAGTQVLVNGVAAPLASVSPKDVTFVVPYSTPADVAEVQVVNNGTPSNVVTSFMALTSPGLFTIPMAGESLLTALHADNQLVRPGNPAQIGETIRIFSTGFGQVKPVVAAGMAGPVSPLSSAVAKIQAYVDGIPATVTYAGLAPGLVGVYRIDISVPAGIRSGNVYVDISGPESDVSQAYLAIAGGTDGMTKSLNLSTSQDTRRTRRPRYSRLNQLTNDGLSLRSGSRAPISGLN